MERRTVNLRHKGKERKVRLSVPNGTSKEQIMQYLKGAGQEKLKTMLESQPEVSEQPLMTEESRKTYQKALTTPYDPDKPTNLLNVGVQAALGKKPMKFQSGRPYGLIGSLRMGFAEEDTPQRMKALEEEFGKENVMLTQFGPSVKNTKTNRWQVTDQPKLGSGNAWQKATEALHDIMDVAPEGIRLAGEIPGTIAGAALGTSVGQPAKGAIAGAGIGRGTGELVTEGLGALMGVDKTSLKEAGIEAGIETGIGAISEASAQTIKGVGKFLKQQLKKLGDNSMKQFLILANGYSPGEADYAVKTKFDFFTKANLRPERDLEIASKASKAAEKIIRQTGKQFDDLSVNYSNDLINTTPIIEKFINRTVKDGVAEVAEDGSLKFIKAGGKLTKDVKALQEAYKRLLNITDDKGFAKFKNIKALQDQVLGYEPKPNKYAAVKVDLDRVIKDQLEEHFGEAYSTPRHKQAFYRKLKQDLLDTKLTTDVGKAGQTKKFIHNYHKAPLEVKKALQQLDNETDDKFLTMLMDRAAATTAGDTNINLLRAGIMGGALGLQFGGPGYVAGAALTIPKVTATIGKTTGKLSKPVSKGIGYVNKQFLEPLIAPTVAGMAETKKRNVLKQQAIRNALEKNKKQNTMSQQRRNAMEMMLH